MKAFLIILALLSTAIWFGFKKPEQGVPDINKGKVVIQLNYDWNKQNSYQWKVVNGVSYYFLSLDKFPDLKAKMKIKTVPTIIVLNNGQEAKRVEGGLMMKITSAQSEIMK
jgi:thiol-disulfide isomerase/thioredoxin